MQFKKEHVMAKQTKCEVLNLSFVGIQDLMFDRYPGDNSTKLPNEQKLYLDGKKVTLPSMNILSLLTAENTKSITQKVYGKSYKKVADELRSSLTIEQQLIPILRNGKPLLFNGSFDNERGGSIGIYIDRRVARLAKGVPNPKERPTVQTPWEMNVTIELDANDEITTQELINLLRLGGRKIGLGTYRGVYGRFNVKVTSVEPGETLEVPAVADIDTEV
jgi:hypothetical protein